MQIESKGGSRYMVTFTDDYSRYTTILLSVKMKYYHPNFKSLLPL